MDNTISIVASMAEQCRGLILESKSVDLDLPNALQPKHLVWICDKIIEHADDGPATKLHRWIGFVQCAMFAHRMLDAKGARAMLDQAKAAHGEANEDLVDHLDPASSFEFELGGEG